MNNVKYKQDILSSIVDVYTRRNKTKDELLKARFDNDFITKSKY